VVTVVVLACRPTGKWSVPGGWGYGLWWSRATTAVIPATRTCSALPRGGKKRPLCRYDPGAPWRRWPITEHDCAAGSPQPRPPRMLLHAGHPFCAGGHAKVATAAAAAADRGSASS